MNLLVQKKASEMLVSFPFNCRHNRESRLTGSWHFQGGRCLFSPNTEVYLLCGALTPEGAEMGLPPLTESRLPPLPLHL